MHLYHQRGETFTGITSLHLEVQQDVFQQLHVVALEESLRRGIQIFLSKT